METNQIWDALDKGQKVFWTHKGYSVHAVEYTLGVNDASRLSYRDGFALRVTCTANYFGGLIHAIELSACFIGADHE